MKARLLVVYFIMSAGLAVVAGDSVPGVITTVVGDGTRGFSGDGGPATSAQINVPSGMAFDSAGNLYFSDSENHRIRKVTRDGYISTVAGNGTFGDSGDGGSAIRAQLSNPAGIAFDSAGNLYIAESYFYGHVRKVTPDGVIRAVAGTHGASHVALDKEGNLYVAKLGVFDPSLVYKMTPDGSQSIVAGAASPPSALPQEGVEATSIYLGWAISGIAIDPDGNLLIAASGRILKVMPDGKIHIVAGGGDQGLGEGGPAIAAEIAPHGLAVDAQGSIFTADVGFRRALIRKVTIDGRISTVAGKGTVGYSGDGGPALSAELNDPRNVALDSSGNLYIADSGNQRIRKVDAVGIVGSTSYFPQLAVGGGWSTLFTFTNTGPAEASGLLTLKDSQGNALLVKGQWGNSAGTEDPASSFAFSVPSGGSISLLATAADIADTRRTGWAQLETAGSPVSGMASYEHAAGSTTDSIVSIPYSQPIQLAVIPVDVDSSSGKQPAYCIVNPGSQSISINFSLIAEDGAVKDNSIRVTLGPGEQIARYPFLQDLALDKFKGSLVIRAESGQKFLTIGLFEKQGLFAWIPLARIE